MPSGSEPHGLPACGGERTASPGRRLPCAPLRAAPEARAGVALAPKLDSAGCALADAIKRCAALR